MGRCKHAVRIAWQAALAALAVFVLLVLGFGIAYWPGWPIRAPLGNPHRLPLTPAHLSFLRYGMTEQEVRALLGRPKIAAMTFYDGPRSFWDEDQLTYRLAGGGSLTLIIGNDFLVQADTWSGTPPERVPRRKDDWPPPEDRGKPLPIHRH